MLLAAMALAVDGLDAVNGLVGGTDGFYRIVQDRLIGLDLCDQEISSVLGCLKSFF